MAVTITDTLLKTVYKKLGIASLDARGKYLRIDDIVSELSSINAKSTINPKTTGTLSERLCQLALEAAADNIYELMDQSWKWVGDFYLLGSPFNIIISVKSFKTKERLLASGTGNVLSPTIAWGLFDDVTEWSLNRVQAYLYRGFFAIYMPTQLYRSLDTATWELRNINGKPFLRTLDNFMSDLTVAQVEIQRRKGKATVIDPRKM